MNTETELKPAVEGEMEYAGFWIRFLAFIIDVLLLWIISWGIVDVLYFIGLWAWRGQTLGQVAFDIQVVGTDGRPSDLRIAVLRYLGYWLCALTLGIGFLFIAFNDRKQGLHDWIADTYVVRVPRK